MIKAQRASAFLSEQQHSQVGRQVGYWRADVANLQKVIDSGGMVTINPSTDPQVQSLTRQRTAEQTQETRYYQQWQCQLYGGKGCSVKGNGPLAKASEASYHQAAAQVATLTREIQQRERQLSATDAASKRARYNQAKSALPAAQQQLTVAVARQNELQQTFDARNESTNGLLIRLQALNQLSGKSLTLNGARLLLFLLFLVIECLPVTVKVLQRPGNYEKILQTAAETELKEANRSYRRIRRSTATPGAATPGAATAADPRPVRPTPTKPCGASGADRSRESCPTGRPGRRRNRCRGSGPSSRMTPRCTPVSTMLPCAGWTTCAVAVSGAGTAPATPAKPSILAAGAGHRAELRRR